MGVLENAFRRVSEPTSWAEIDCGLADCRLALSLLCQCCAVSSLPPDTVAVMRHRAGSLYSTADRRMDNLLRVGLEIICFLFFLMMIMLLFSKKIIFGCVGSWLLCAGFL